MDLAGRGGLAGGEGLLGQGSCLGTKVCFLAEGGHMVEERDLAAGTGKGCGEDLAEEGE